MAFKFAQDIPVLKIDVSALDFLANETDLAQCQTVRTQLNIRLPEPQPAEMPHSLLQEGRISAFQQFHRQLDQQRFRP